MTNWKHQLSRFMLVGLVSTLLNYAVFFSAAYLLHVYYLAASMIGYLTGLTLGYTLNRNWTFSAQKATTHQHYEMVRYIAVNLTSLALGLLLLHGLVDWAGLPAWFGNILVIGLTTITNFSGLKFAVFKSQPAK